MTVNRILPGIMVFVNAVLIGISDQPFMFAGFLVAWATLYIGECILEAKS